MNKKNRPSPIITPSGFIKELICAAKTLVQPYLVAIYDLNNGMAVQIGTAFLVKWKCAPVLITAKHVLFGHDFKENPGEKFLFVNGRLKQISCCNTSDVFKIEEHDLCAIQVNDFSIDQCFNFPVLQTQISTTDQLSVLGYLARDFRRNAREETLRPSPFLYTNSYFDCKAGYVGITYNSRSTSTHSNGKVRPPIPRGLSGGPIFRAHKLLLNQVEIVGVFTEERISEGYVFGEEVQKVIELLKAI